MLDNLTERQREVLESIRDSFDRRGIPPTLREIMDQFGIVSTNGVACHLKALQKKGLIDWEPRGYRSIRLTDQAKEKAGIPLLTLKDIAASGGW